MKKENVIENKSFDFALQIIKIYKLLVEEKEFIISKRLIRSGTSIGANLSESFSAVSRRDFIHKLTYSTKRSA